MLFSPPFSFFIQVLRRTLQIFFGLGSFAFKLWLDQLQGQLDQNRRLRAVELRNIFTGLGPTFVKIGQGLSTRPDLCPPEFLEELSELQVFTSFITKTNLSSMYIYTIYYTTPLLKQFNGSPPNYVLHLTNHLNYATQ